MESKILDYKWDEVDIIELQSNNYIARIIPSLGGNIVKLSFHEEDILNTPKNLDTYKNTQNNFGIPHLFPPNRIKDGRFIFGGRVHQFPVKQSGNSLHGFLHFSQWKVEEKKIKGTDVSLKLSYTSNENKNYYSYFPYKFRCTREYILNKDGLTESYSIENLGNRPMPLSVGYHTAFPIKDRDTVKIRVDIEKKVVLDTKKIPTGEVRNLDDYEALIKEGRADPNFKNLDNLYIAKKTDKEKYHNAIITGSHSKGNIIYKVDEKYRYWVLCNYSSRGDIICIEPQTSSIDAHNRVDGNLITLDARDTWKTTNKLYIKREN